MHGDLKLMNKRVYAYGAALSLGLVAFVWNTIQVHGLESELQGIADEKIADFTAEEPDEIRAQLQIGATVVATHAYVLFGEVSGKVSVYLQHNEGDQSKMEGFEFFFERDESGIWTQTESGMCTSDECTKEGLRVLKALDSN